MKNMQARLKIKTKISTKIEWTDSKTTTIPA